MPDFDAVIVGASLAGCATAVHLGRAGQAGGAGRAPAGPGGLQEGLRALHPVQRRPVARAPRRAGASSPARPRGHARVWTPLRLVRRARSARARSLSVRRERARPAPAPPRRRDARRRAAARPHARGRRARVACGCVGATRPSSTARLLVGADGRGSRTAELAGLRDAHEPERALRLLGLLRGPAARHRGERAPLAARQRRRRHRHAHRRRPDALRRLPALRARARVQARPRGRAARLHGRAPRRPADRSTPGSPGRSSASSTSPTSGAPPSRRASRWSATPPSPPTRSGRSAAAGRCSRRSGSPRSSVPESGGRAAPLRPPRHRRALLGHSLMAADGSLAKGMNPPQRLLFSAAVHDPRTAERIGAFASREILPRQLLSPPVLARAAAVNARHRIARRTRERC